MLSNNIKYFFTNPISFREIHITCRLVLYTIVPCPSSYIPQSAPQDAANPQDTDLNGWAE